MHHRILNAVNFMEARLGKNVPAKNIAKEASLSEYHFYRIFKSMTGMSPGLYIRRGRLSLAAQRLLKGETNILNLALDSGYDSQEAFTRPFKEMFGISPGRFRTGASNPEPLLQCPLDLETLQYFDAGGLSLKPDIKKRSAFRVTGLNRTFSFDAYTDMHLLWREFLDMLKKHGPYPPEVYGVCQGTALQGRPNDELDYAATCLWSPEGEYPGNFETIDIPANTYAVFTHHGLMSEMPMALRYIWQVWVPRCGYELADAPDFEIYTENFDNQPMAEKVEIYIPVQA